MEAESWDKTLRDLYVYVYSNIYENRIRVILVNSKLDKIFHDLPSSTVTLY